jgi:hypothetical protein
VLNLLQPLLLSRVAIWPLKTPNQPYLAFLKQFVRNKIIWPFGHFLAFLDLDENSIFLAYFGNMSTQHATFYGIRKFICYILANFL